MAMFPDPLRLTALVLLVITTGCNRQETPTAGSNRTLNEIMTASMDVHADQLWAISNKAIGEQGGIEPGKLSEADWQQLAIEAGELRKAATEIAQLETIATAKPGVRILNEGMPGVAGAAEVQRVVDSNPQAVRDLAKTFALHVARIETAVKARDAKAAGALIDQLDGACETCHTAIWYPELKAASIAKGRLPSDQPR